jgi:DNA-binding beta-propeller fold protein YncE
MKEVIMYRHKVKALTCGVLAGVCAVVAHAQSIKTQIPFAQSPAGIAANSVTNRIYVAAPSYGGATDSITVINGGTDSISAQIPVPVGAQYPAVDIMRNRILVAGCNLYSENFSCIVTLIQGGTNKVLKTATITTTEGDGILGVAFDPILNKLYIANGSDLRIDVVDGASLRLEGSISTSGQEPFGLSFNPTNHRLYAVYYSNTVDTFDTYNRNLLATTTVGSRNVADAVNWVTGNVFVTDNVFGPSTTSVLDKNGNVLASVPVSETPYGVDVDPITNKAFVVSTGIPALSVISGSTNTVLATLQGVSANYVAVNFASEKVYLSGNSGVIVVTEK